MFLRISEEFLLNILLNESFLIFLRGMCFFLIFVSLLLSFFHFVSILSEGSKEILVISSEISDQVSGCVLILLGILMNFVFFDVFSILRKLIRVIFMVL